MDCEPLSQERVSAVATRLINLGWFRVGSEQYVKTSRTFGIATLRKSHVSVRGKRIAFRYRTKGRAWVHRAVVDAELAEAVKDLLECPGGSRLFRYRTNGELCNLTSTKLNEYIKAYMGSQFSAKDFRTWGGTLLAAIAFAGRKTPRNEGASAPLDCLGHEVGRRAARKYACGRPIRLRQSGGCRAVSRGPYARGFSAGAFARRWRSG